MRVRFWGTRGSIPKPGPSTVRFGGNTSCIEVRSDAGTLVTLDCGTGAHGFGQTLMESETKPVRGHILITHTHWDHIQGIPFFAPLFDPNNEFDIYAPRGLGPSIRDSLSGQMQYTYFPVTLEALGATIRYHDLVEGTFEIGDIRVRARFMNHPALTMGYRLEADGTSLVYACDHEPYSSQYALGTGPMDEQDRRHVDFMAGAHLVIHDAQYTRAEYEKKIGWGHSTIDSVVDMCRAGRVERLALTHHDPMRDDTSLDRICAALAHGNTRARGRLDVFAAAEGMCLELERESAGRRAGMHTPPAISALHTAVHRQPLVIAVGDEGLATRLDEVAAADNLPTTRAVTAIEILTLVRSDQASVVIIDDSLDDAFSICRAIRGLEPEENNDVPVLMVADARSEAGAEAGISDWLVRPFSQQYARARVHAWVIRSACRWVPAPLPANEEARIGALNALRLLDTDREERFDRITRIAAAALDMPIALVSFVDRDRQWFKSRHGLDVDETPREQGFCAHAILGTDVMVVPDAYLDRRFADNPLVTREIRIRFYAGYPLTLPDGTHPGSLCVIDHRPRDLSPSRIELLRELGRLVELELISAGNHG